MSEQGTRINMPLDEELTKKIQKIKEFWGITTNTDIIRFLIKKEVRQIQIEEKKEII